MRRSSRKMLIVGALTLTALTGPMAAASAADTLTLTPVPTAAATQTVKVTGTASGDSLLYAWAERFGTTCSATEFDHRFDPDRELVPIGTDPANPDPAAHLTAGDFNVLLRWAPLPAGGYKLCVYLNGSSQLPGTAPLAFASAQLVLVDDADSDGVPDDVDACPNVQGSQADGCPPPATQPVTPVTPVTTVTTPTAPGGAPTAPSAKAPAAGDDPTGVLKLKPSKGKATSCGTGCLVRTRTVGPFTYVLKVKVSGSKTKATGSATLTRKSPQAGLSGTVCLGRFAAKPGKTCKTVKWTVGKTFTVTGSMPTPSAIGKSGRPGFGISANVGKAYVGVGAVVYLKSAGGKVKPDTNESACAASAGAHAAC